MTIRTNAGEAELASPFDAFPHFLELPPVKREYLAGAARFKLRSLHPGDPLSTRVDVRTAEAAGKAPAFDAATPIRVVAHAAPFTEATGEPRLPSIPGYTLLASGWREYRRQGGGKDPVVTGILVADTWLQAVRFENGIAVAGAARRFESPEGFSQSAAACAESLPPVARDSEPSSLFEVRLPGSSKTPFPALNGYARAIAVDPERVISGVRLSADLLFKPERKGVSRALAVTVSLLACIAVFAAGIRLDKIARLWEAEAKTAKSEYERRRKDTAEIMNLIKERDGLLAEAASRESDSAADVYLVFSRLAELLPGAQLTSFSLQDGNLKFTAKASDALVAVARIRGDSFFTDVNLVQAAPNPEGGDVFSVSGKVAK